MQGTSVIVQMNYSHTVKYVVTAEAVIGNMSTGIHIFAYHTLCKNEWINKSINTFSKSKVPEASVADLIRMQEDVGLLFPCSLIYGYSIHHLPACSKVPSVHGVFRAEPPCCVNTMAVIWRWRDNWVSPPQALEITSTGGRWMMARKRQRPGDYSLTSCNFSIIYIIIVIWNFPQGGSFIFNYTSPSRQWTTNHVDHPQDLVWSMQRWLSQIQTVHTQCMHNMCMQKHNMHCL